MVLVEWDEDLCIAYATTTHHTPSTIQDQVVLPSVTASDDIQIRWNSDGHRAAIIINQQLIMIFDFNACVTHCEPLTPDLPTQWARQTLQVSRDVSIEFHLDDFFEQPDLNAAIDRVASDDTHIHRLLFYKSLLTATLFVPITTTTPDDPDSLIYMFPNDADNGLDHNGHLIFGYTNRAIFMDQMGQHGLAYQKISADFLCYQSLSFHNILGMMVMSSTGSTVLLTRHEFELLAVISEPHRLNDHELLAAMGTVFFETVMDDSTSTVKAYFTRHFASSSLVRGGYYCRSKLEGNQPIFFVIVASTAPSHALSAIIDHMNGIKQSLACDGYVLRTDHVVAKAITRSQSPI